MTVYGLYVFDRHCTCTFYANFNGKGPRAGPSTLPNVYRPSLRPSSLPVASSSQRRDSVAPAAFDKAVLPPWDKSGAWDKGSPWDKGSGGGTEGGRGMDGEGAGADKDGESRTGLAFDEEAKLVYGIIYSLRNMVKKLAGREDDSFHSFATSAYKVHYLYTATATHFVLVTSPLAESLRFVLRQIYTGPFNEFVVRNPMVGLDSRETGKGIDNDLFRAAVEKIVGGL